ncbi:hypothetical protein B9Z65_755 [Elsinoe australis]|uniref:Uncharacterized protein n=1 Tax=Elsinoe australis TaxID=40998 RepID=A0A2P8AJE9_9PEZI|nr:hypothetical protein B9Z65_755 [Elsinoe australis]
MKVSIAVSSLLVSGAVASEEARLVTRAGPTCTSLKTQIAQVNGAVTSPVPFCTFVIKSTASKTPITGLTIDSITQACQCIIKTAGQTVPTKGNPPAFTQPKNLACDSKSQATVAKGFKTPAPFCQYMSSVTATAAKLSPMSNLDTTSILNGCQCITNPKASGTSKSTSTAKTTTGKGAATSKSATGKTTTGKPTGKTTTGKATGKTTGKTTTGKTTTGKATGKTTKVVTTTKAATTKAATTKAATTTKVTTTSPKTTTTASPSTTAPATTTMKSTTTTTTTTTTTVDTCIASATATAYQSPAAQQHLYKQIYKGTGNVEASDNPANSDSATYAPFGYPMGDVDCATDAINGCIQTAVNQPGKQYGNVDVHFNTTDSQWYCVGYAGTGSSAAEWDVQSADVGSAYGYELVSS